MTYRSRGGRNLAVAHVARHLHKTLHVLMLDVTMTQVALDTGISLRVLERWNCEPEALAERHHEKVREWIREKAT